MLFLVPDAFGFPFVCYEWCEEEERKAFEAGRKHARSFIADHGNAISEARPWMIHAADKEFVYEQTLVMPVSQAKDALKDLKEVCEFSPLRGM